MTTSVAKHDGAKVEAFDADKARRLFESLAAKAETDYGAIERYYHPQVRFHDPIQVVDGRDAFVEVTERFMKNAKNLEVEVHAAVQSASFIFLAWTMRANMGPGPRLTIEGTSKLVLDAQGKVIEHRDYFDLWGDAVGSVPVVGPLYRKLMKVFG